MGFCSLYDNNCCCYNNYKITCASKLNWSNKYGLYIVNPLCKLNWSNKCGLYSQPSMQAELVKQVWAVVNPLIHCEVDLVELDMAIYGSPSN